MWPLHKCLLQLEFYIQWLTLAFFKLLLLYSKSFMGIEITTCVGNFSPALEARNQVGIGLSYRPASQCSLDTQFQTRFLESTPRPIARLKFSPLAPSLPLSFLYGIKYVEWGPCTLQGNIVSRAPRVSSFNSQCWRSKYSTKKMAIFHYIQIMTLPIFFKD
jgi:hypothetical protein